MNKNFDYRKILTSLVSRWNAESDKFQEIQKDSADDLKTLRQGLKNTGTAFELGFA
ncbi:MAG: hypothetical protein V2I97_06970 [Desulfococcaceae bacterium]|nr:hypothetical protein [Desulfococcaceae bacterium]